MTRAKGKVEMESRDAPKARARRWQAQGRQDQANLEDPREVLREKRTAVDTKDRAGRMVVWDTSGWSVDGESLVEEEDVACRKSEDNLTEEDEEVGGVWIVWNVEELDRRGWDARYFLLVAMIIAACRHCASLPDA